MSVDELILNLTKPVASRFDDVVRVEARAQLIRLVGNDSSQRTAQSKLMHFVAPLGSIEAQELSWYLERYMQWPTGTFRKRAEAVERGFPHWGRALFDAVATDEVSRSLIHQWQHAGGSGRRLTIRIDIGEDSNQGDRSDVGLAGARLLGIPWELLHDGQDYLVEDSTLACVRRQIHRKQQENLRPSELPIRILLVSPRPEDEEVGYIDHRASALPLVGALERISDAELTLLVPPTFQAFAQELKRAAEEGMPYHVVHFDGHGQPV